MGRGTEKRRARIYIEIKFGRGAKSLSANLYLTVHHRDRIRPRGRHRFTKGQVCRRHTIIIIIIIITVVFNIKRVHIFGPYACVNRPVLLLLVYAADVCVCVCIVDIYTNIYTSLS